MTRKRTPHDILTPQKWEVLSPLSDGQTVAQIDERLSISKKNAEDEVAHIFSKLRVGDGTPVARLSRSLQSEEQPFPVRALSSLFKKTSVQAVLRCWGWPQALSSMAIADLVVGFS